MSTESKQEPRKHISMSNETKQEPSQSLESESQQEETVPIEEYNALKRKLRKTEAALARQKNKLKLMETQILFSDLQGQPPKGTDDDLPVPVIEEDEDGNKPCCSKAVKK